MSAAARLGLRLALRGGRTRAAAVTICSSLGVLLLLLCAELPDSLDVSPTDRSVLQVLTLAVSLPVIALVVSVCRLSSETRDRRLAALRLAGLSRSRALVVAATEAGVFVFVGALLGGLLHALVRDTAARAALRRGWIHFPAEYLPSRSVLVVLSVTAVAAVLSSRPATRSAAASLQGSRPVPSARVPWWALVVTGAGLAIGVWAARRTPPEVAGPIDITPVGLALLLCGVGLIGAGTALTVLIARALRRAPGAAAAVTSARMRSDRAATGRALAGLTVATFVATFGLSVLSVFTHTPQYVDAVWAVDHPTSEVVAVDGANAASLATRARRLPDVTDARPAFRPTFVTEDHQAYAGVLVMSCADLTRRAIVGEGCSDRHAWLATSDGHPVPLRPAELTVGGRSLHVGPPSTGLLDSPSRRAGGLGFDWLPSYGATLVVPPSIVAATGATPNAVLLDLKAGHQDFMLPTPGDAGVVLASYGRADYEQVQSYRRLTLLLVTAVMSVAMLTVVVSVVDRLTERRRRVASLRAMGTPATVLGLAQLLGLALPMLVGVTLAMVAGGVVGRAYLAYADPAYQLPTSDLARLWAWAVAAGLVVAALTVPGVGRPLTADLLRRE